MKTTLVYCYDAYCGWSYGFSSIIKQIHAAYSNILDFEVLSGGMILPEKPVHLKATASYINAVYKDVEKLTGVTFGKDYLWHIYNADKSDWFPDSEKPAIALCIIKDIFPSKQVEFAADLQYALYAEGRDLTDDEAYRHLLPVYNIREDEFYTKLKSESFKENARYEFALVKQLRVTGYPCVLIRLSKTKFHIVAHGYTCYETLKQNIDAVLKQEFPRPK